MIISGSRGARLAGEAVSKGSGVVGPIVYLRSIVCEGVSSTVHLRGHLITEVRGSTIECKNELGLSHDVALLTTASQARQRATRHRSTRHAPRGTLHEARSTILDARNLDAVRIRPQ